jgi:predicted RecA/RadA family phage recombinase
MSSYLNAAPEVLRAEVRLLLERMLELPKTAAEKAVVGAKLADVSLTLQAARAGKAVVVPMGWDEDQRALWDLLVDFHAV